MSSGGRSYLGLVHRNLIFGYHGSSVDNAGNTFVSSSFYIFICYLFYLFLFVLFVLFGLFGLFVLFVLFVLFMTISLGFLPMQYVVGTRGLSFQSIESNVCPQTNPLDNFCCQNDVTRLPFSRIMRHTQAWASSESGIIRRTPR